MRLSYNILWVENESEWLEPTLEYVKGVLEDNGFELNPTIRSSEEEIEDLLKDEEPFKNFDLILVDFNLNRGDRGNKIIENIREHKIFTEVIFYSQDSEGIRQAIKDHWLDGIYCSSRNRSDFEFKFEKVFLTTIKKIQHISTIRGLVLSETSQLDNKIEEIILAFFQNRPKEEANRLKKYIINDLIKSSIKESSKKADKLDEAISYQDLLDNRLFDAYKKMRTTAKILSIINVDNLINKEEFLKEYNDEVIGIRNELAHANEIIVDNKNILRCINGNKEFNELECIKVRKNLKKHFGYLNKIKENI